MAAIPLVPGKIQCPLSTGGHHWVVVDVEEEIAAKLVDTPALSIVSVA